MSIFTFDIQDSSQGYVPSYFYKLLRDLYPSRMLIELSLKPVYSTVVGKNGVYSNLWCLYSWKMRWIWIFLLMPPSLVKTLLQILVITLPQGEGNYSLSQATLFRKSVSPNSRKEWKKIWFALSKLIQKIWRWLKALGYLYFVWSVFFQTWWL